jgi:predicted nucleotidyltransferase
VVESPTGQRALLVALVDAHVRFVVIGGHAVAAHGYERATRDVDIVFATDHENCVRFAELLSRVDADVRMSDLPAPGGQITPEWLAGGGHFVFGTAHGPLDALTWIAGLDHAKLDSRALTVALADGTELRVCSYDDLVAMKRLADRPRDREDLRELEALRDEDD